MIKYFILSLLIVSQTHAQETDVELYEVPDPTLTTPVVSTSEASEPLDERDFNPRKGHLVVTFAAEGLQYDLPIAFEGERESFGEEDAKRKLYGGRLGVGLEMYIGGGFNTTSKIQGYYVGSLFSSKQSADPEVEDIEFAFTKETGSLYGVEVAQSLGYIFDYSTQTLFGNRTMLYLEPFVEAGIGAAQAYNRLNYHYDTGPGGVQEDYKLTIKDRLMSGRLSLGMNVISSEGYFLHMKLSQTMYNIMKREIEEQILRDGSGGIVDNDREADDTEIDPVYSFTLGGGFKF